MIKFLPFIIIPLLILAGLGYWRYSASSQNLKSPQVSQVIENQEPLEVPKTLPNATTEDRLKSLEDAISKLVPQVNSLKTSIPQTGLSSLEAKVAGLDAAVTELKARVSALEKSTPAPASGYKYPLYIPLGSGGGPWGDQGWHSLNEYQATINTDNYPGYTGMQLEVNFRLTEAVGTGSVRLYNITDSSAVSSGQIDTTSISFGLKTSAAFKLPGGQKTYTIQVQSTQGASLFIQTARIKVSF